MINANVRSTERMSDVNTKVERGEKTASARAFALRSFARSLFVSLLVRTHFHTSSRLMNNPASDGARRASDASDRIFRGAKKNCVSSIILSKAELILYSTCYMLFHQRWGLFPSSGAQLLVSLKYRR